MTSPLIYNERLKLAATAVNLVAIGFIALGVTTPLVAITLGPPFDNGQTAESLAPVMLFWMICGFITHLRAQWILGNLVG